MNRWVGHRLVEFGSAPCQNCGNEHIRHLHRVNTDKGIIEVGCICAANLCSDQQAEIEAAERLMERRDANRKLLDGLKAGWKQTKKKGHIQKLTSHYGSTEVAVTWENGLGWTVNIHGAPHHPEPRGWEKCVEWAQDYYEKK